MELYIIRMLRLSAFQRCKGNGSMFNESWRICVLIQTGYFSRELTSVGDTGKGTIVWISYLCDRISSWNLFGRKIKSFSQTINGKRIIKSNCVDFIYRWICGIRCISLFCSGNFIFIWLLQFNVRYYLIFSIIWSAVFTII